MAPEHRGNPRPLLGDALPLQGAESASPCGVANRVNAARKLSVRGVAHRGTRPRGVARPEDKPGLNSRAAFAACRGPTARGVAHPEALPELG